MNKQVNIALQVLPLKTRNVDPIHIIDKAIEAIAASGLNYVVTPFETVIEGKYEEIMDVIQHVHHKCYVAGADELICNLKIHSSMHDVSISDKMEKYENYEEEVDE